MIREKVKVISPGPTEDSTMASGKLGSKMEKELTSAKKKCLKGANGREEERLDGSNDISLSLLEY
jgi:hypothetical protein